MPNEMPPGDLQQAIKSPKPVKVKAPKKAPEPKPDSSGPQRWVQTDAPILPVVAGANLAQWRDIMLANRDALAGQIDGVQRRLAEVRAALEAGDAEALLAFQEAAAGERRALLETQLGGGPQRELHVAVPNRPGVIAELALRLGRAGINISDMALAPSPDMKQGEVTLWVAARDAARAAEILGVDA